eukprot:scaffold71850_cov33-Prasinocladus_malaysianus.AAC.1
MGISLAVPGRQGLEHPAGCQNRAGGVAAGAGRQHHQGPSRPSDRPLMLGAHKAQTVRSHAIKSRHTHVLNWTSSNQKAALENLLIDAYLYVICSSHD